MSYDEVRRQLIIDLLAELRADPWKEPTWEDVEPILSEEQMIDIKVRVRREGKRRFAIMNADGKIYWGKSEERLTSYLYDWELAVSQEEKILRMMEVQDSKIDQADDVAMNTPFNKVGDTPASRLRSWVGQILAYRSRLANRYAQLSDRERMFLTRPTPNPHYCRDYPKPSIIERGFFYPEDTGNRKVVMEMLEWELESIERQSGPF